MAAIDEIERSIKSVFQKAGPFVVGIAGPWGAGSGVVLGEGKILTNAHNLRGERVTVILVEGQEIEARTLGTDLDGDLAVVSADIEDAPGIEWADDQPDVGDAVFALANPGGRGLRVTVGFVSGTRRVFRGPRGRRVPGALEHTAPLLPGSSGGPVVDAQGRLLGINTHRLGEGFYLAIPADEALRQRVDALARGEAPARPHIGIGIAPRQVARGLRRAVGLPEAEGLLVQLVESGSAAESAGVSEGDLIVSAGGLAITDVDDLYRAIEVLPTGAPLVLSLLRGIDTRDVSVQLR